MVHNHLEAMICPPVPAIGDKKGAGTFMGTEAGIIAWMAMVGLKVAVATAGHQAPSTEMVDRTKAYIWEANTGLALADPKVPSWRTILILHGYVFHRTMQASP